MIQLKAATLTDHRGIARLHGASWQQTYRGIYSDSFLNGEVEKDRLQVWKDRLTMPSEKQIVTIAIADGELAGFSCVVIDDDQVFGSLLDNLHVASSFQGTGVGKILLQYCAQTILEKAVYPMMYLWVYEANMKARKVYEHLGARHYEMVLHRNVDDSTANACRYIWEDVSVLLA